ncbi:MAG: flippase [Candidatus Zixiibacteriota bacterium]|nr:MAG: flippase [candidate division Zixibacteria bacterium]
MGIRRNLALQSLTHTLSRGMGFLFFLVLARLLGAEHFGRFSFALGVGALLSIFMEFGLEPLIIKWTARGRHTLVAAAVRLRLISSAGILVLLLAALPFVPRADTLLLALMGLFFALQTLMQTHSFAFQGMEKMEWELGVSGLQKAGAIALALLLVTLRPAPEMGALSLVVSALAGLAAARWIVRRRRLAVLDFPLPGKSWTIPGADLKAVLRESLPLVVMAVGWSIYFKIDVVLLKLFVEDRDIGLYSSAYKLLEGMTIFPSILLAAIFPALSRRAVADPARARRLFRQALILLLPAAALLALALRQWGGRLILALFGPDYLEAAPLLAILALALLALFPGYLVTKSLLAYDRNLLFAGITLAAAGLNVGLNLVLIPRLGAAGAAWATVATESFVTLACGIAVQVIQTSNRTSVTAGRAAG